MQFEAIARYALALLALFILLRCTLSLFRLKPRKETLATLLNLANDEEIPIDHWETSIGRSRACDIALKKYGTVSRFHAVLALRKDGWHVFDTESKTGVYINGEQIRKSGTLKDGDTLSFGNAVMRFQSNGYGEKAAGSNENINYTSATRLVNLADNSAFYLENDCLIGRNRNCNICLPMKDIALEHAEVYLSKDGWMLTDLTQKGDTYLNEESVFGTFPLYDGDVISLGEYRFLFRES